MNMDSLVSAVSSTPSPFFLLAWFGQQRARARPRLPLPVLDSCLSGRLQTHQTSALTRARVRLCEVARPLSYPLLVHNGFFRQQEKLSL
jgi:hypothetical protein